MRRLATATAAVFSLLLFARQAHAQERPFVDSAVIRTAGEPNLVEGQFGIGLQFGCPSGLAIKLRLATASSFQAGAGFGCGEDFFLTGDYVLEMGNFLVDPHNFQLSWYAGIGGRYAITDNGPARNRTNTDLGPRVPIGIEAHFQQMKPLELFVEIAPGIDLVDDPGVTVDAAVGARWFF